MRSRYPLLIPVNLKHSLAGAASDRARKDPLADRAIPTQSLRRNRFGVAGIPNHFVTRLDLLDRGKVFEQEGPWTTRGVKPVKRHIRNLLQALPIPIERGSSAITRVEKAIGRVEIAACHTQNRATTRESAAAAHCPADGVSQPEAIIVNKPSITRSERAVTAVLNVTINDNYPAGPQILARRWCLVETRRITTVHGIVPSVSVKVEAASDSYGILRQEAPQLWVIVARPHEVQLRLLIELCPA